MKPIDLYERVPKEVSFDMNRIVNGRGCFDDIEGLEDHWFVDVEQDKIKIHFYEEHCFDGRRLWVLAAIYFRDMPVMITQNAGREGDDHGRRFVTDLDMFLDMRAYILELMNSDVDVPKDIFDPDKDIEDLTTFYGNELETVSSVKY